MDNSEVRNQKLECRSPSSLGDSGVLCRRQAPSDGSTGAGGSVNSAEVVGRVDCGFRSGRTQHVVERPDPTRQCCTPQLDPFVLCCHERVADVVSIKV